MVKKLLNPLFISPAQSMRRFRADYRTIILTIIYSSGASVQIILVSKSYMMLGYIMLNFIETSFMFFSLTSDIITYECTKRMM